MLMHARVMPLAAERLRELPAETVNVLLQMLNESEVSLGQETALDIMSYIYAHKISHELC